MDKMEYIRNDFPELENSGYTYLDNAATTWKPQSVLSAMNDFYSSSYSNIHRSAYALGIRAEECYEEARSEIAHFLRAGEEYQVVFTHGATDALNLLASCVTEQAPKGSNIVITQLEHHSNYLPWVECCRRRRIGLRVIPVRTDGGLDMEAFYAMTDKNTAVVSVTGASNVSGYMPPLQDLEKHTHQMGAAFIVDGSQLVAHCRMDLENTGYDAFCFSGHKLYGPTGIGVLCGKRDFLETLGCYQLGGGMVQDICFLQNKIKLAELPYCLEAGTPPIVEAIGLKAAITYLEEHSFEEMLMEEQRLCRLLEEELGELKGIHMFPAGERGIPVKSFSTDFLSAYDIALLLDSARIAARSGQHCAKPLLHALGKDGLIRVSLGIYNNADDIRYLCCMLKRIGERYGRSNS